MDDQKENHLDLRQRKTRKLLVEALAQLLVERPYQEVSVVDICQRAMVHRTTFYAHFNDKQELLRYLLEGLERECASTCLPQEPGWGPREYLLTAGRNVFQFFAQRRELYRACLNSGADAQAHTLEECAAGELCRLLTEPRFREASPQVDPQVAAHFYTGAMLSLIRWWLSSDDPLPIDHLLSNLEQFIPIQ
ncbi:TetR/AcrR family transcriptional regulator [Lawsonibacter sp. LCP25S3_G6]|uniref:TetR/AcrR family transcriptional regulator n=1 Tax=unclassified Lawsonibacter TaxID=2617946 RepID=UPI003F99269C